MGLYPWYVHLYCHMLGSSPELAPQHNPTPISAPQPRCPIHLFRLSVVSSLCRAMRPPDQATKVTKLVASSTMTPQPRLKCSCCLPIPQCSTLHMSHPLWGPPHEPESLHGRVLSFSPGFSNPQQQHQVGIGPPLSNQPHTDIVLNPPPNLQIHRRLCRLWPASCIQVVWLLPVPLPPSQLH